MSLPDSVSERIKSFNSNLLPEKVQIKYSLMAENAYKFYRGTCHLFYEDLSKATLLEKAPLAWICGDLHLENFGSYKGNNRLVYFDLNDFDEAILAPASWELVRIVTSIFIAFESLKIEEEKALRMAELFLKSYCNTLACGKARYIEPRTAKGIVQTFLDVVCHRKQKELLNKRTVLKKKNRLALLIDNRKLFKLEKPLKKELIQYLTYWIKYNEECPYNYKILDIAFRVAGTGSLGIKRYMALLQNLNNAKDYLLIDIKQSRASSLQPYIEIEQPQWSNEAKRVASIQERMQNVPPALLSTTTIKGEPFVIAEMQPIEDNIDFNLIKNRYRDVYQVIDDMAVLTASAQLRSSGRQGSSIADDLIDFGKNNEWRYVIIQYASNYAKQIKRDYNQYYQDYNSGSFTSEEKKPDLQKAV